MMLPLRDHPNPPDFKPWVTWLLIAVNVAVFLLVTLPGSVVAPSATDPRLLAYAESLAPWVGSGPELRAYLSSLTSYDLTVWEYGFRPIEPQVSDLFTSMFLHAGFMHLAGNMLFLWIYGDNVEYRLGPGRFLVAYLVTGLLAVAGHALLNAGSWLPMVGASGAISGVLGFYFLWFPRNKVEVFLAFFPFWFGRVFLPARLLLGFYVLFDNLLPLIASSGGGVAHGAHLGGFFAGLLGAWIWRSRRPPPEPVPDQTRGILPLRGATGWARRRPGHRTRPRF